MIEPTILFTKEMLAEIVERIVLNKIRNITKYVQENRKMFLDTM
ncbi:MAG TPA: hypothetical protein VII94_05580 [Candidatus Saccharimonadales bacterium]